VSADPNSILMGGGIPSAKFKNFGDQVAGTIDDDPIATQQTDIDTGTPLTWNNGDPRMQVVVTLATDLRDDSEDDGLRKVYIKGKSMTAAVRDAVRKAGAKGLERGGQLTVTYTGDGVAERRGLNPPKLYSASYAPPSQAAVNAVLEQPEPAPAPAPGGAVDEQSLQAALANLDPKVLAAIRGQGS
jgi:hypothetical protein